MKRLLAVLTVILLVAVLPVSVFAYKISNDLRVVAKSGGIPEGTVYIDVLLPKEAFGDRFVEFNDNYSVDSCYRFYAGVSQEAFESVELYADDEISQYRLDDYYSFLAHYDGAETEFGTEQLYTYHDYYYGSDKEFDCEAYFTVNAADGEVSVTFDIFQSAKKIKLAYIGEEGNILLISEPFSIKDKPYFASCFRSAFADGEKVKAEYYFSPYILGIYLIIAAAIITIISIVIDKRKAKKPITEPAEAEADGQGETEN